MAEVTPSKIRDPAMLISLASLGAVGVTTALTMKKLTAVEVSNKELENHVLNLGRIVEQYPSAESAAKIFDALGELSNVVREIQKQNDLLAQDNKNLRVLVEIMAQHLAPNVPALQGAIQMRSAEHVSGRSARVDPYSKRTERS